MTTQVRQLRLSLGVGLAVLVIGVLAYSQVTPFEIYEFSSSSMPMPVGRLDIVLRGSEREVRKGMRAVRIIGSPYDLWITATLNGPAAEKLRVTSLELRDDAGARIVLPLVSSEHAPAKAHDDSSLYRLGALFSGIDLPSNHYSAVGTVVLTKGSESIEVPLHFEVHRTFRSEWHVKWWDALMSV